MIFSNGYALIIGVGFDLPKTINDAKNIASFFRDSSRCAYPHDQIRLLVSEDANRDNILSSLANLASQTKNNLESTVVIYFSGHGIYYPGFHILPFGYNLNAISNTAISGDEILEAIKNIQCKKMILVLDCCHAGAIGNLHQSTDIEKGPPPPSFFSILSEGRGRIVISSSRKDEKSLIFHNEENSVFTLALLESLAGLGTAEKDGFVRISDLITYISRNVPNRTQGRQNPVFKFQGLDNFVVAYYSGGATQVKGVDWLNNKPDTHSIRPFDYHILHESLIKQLIKRQENLLLIEERMADYVMYSEIPLLLIKEKRKTEEAIAELEAKLSE